MVCSSDGDTNFLKIVTEVFQGDTLTNDKQYTIFVYNLRESGKSVLSRQLDDNIWYQVFVSHNL